MQKISTIVLYVLVAISVIFAILFYAGGNVEGTELQANPEPLFTALNLSWAYIMFFIAVALTLVFSIHYIATHPKALKGALITIGLGAVLVLIAYLIASDAPVGGRNAEDISTATLKWVGTGLWVTWILGGLAILAIIGSEIYRAFD